MDNVLHAAGTFFVIIASAAVVTLGFFLMRSHNDSSRKVLEELFFLPQPVLRMRCNPEE